MMSEMLTLTPMWLAGVALGTLFFGGLWWTVRTGLSAAQPGWWFFGSMLLRTGITLTGFYLVAGGRLDRLLACLAGFFIARLVVMRLTREAANPPCLTEKVSHAP